jgi:transposase
MTGARFVHDVLEQQGWAVEIADAERVKGFAPIACKTDKVDSMVLATLSQRDLVPAIWLPDPPVREERELAHFRLHLVEHRSMLKNRIHSALISFGRSCPVSDLFGAEAEGCSTASTSPRMPEEGLEPRHADYDCAPRASALCGCSTKYLLIGVFCRFVGCSHSRLFLNLVLTRC